MEHHPLILSAKDVNIQFDLRGKVLHAIRGIDLDIYHGEVLAIVGESGSGKTTLVNLIPRFYDVTGGCIRVDGKDVRKVTLKSLRDHIGMVQQDVYLFAGTIFENIRYGKPDATREEVIAAAKNANAHEFIMAFPDGYDTDIGQRGIKLSGGQKQRVAIAGVVAMEPKCIVFDEPTAMLDPNGRKEVIATAHELNKKKGVTIILITHYMEEVVGADHVYVMEKGKVVMDGTPREIFSRVDELKEHRLDVPQVTLVADELKKSGLDIPDGILTREELVNALVALKNR